MAFSVPGVIRLALAPPIESVTAEALRFPGADLATRPGLDRIPQSVVVGFESAMESPDPRDIKARVGLMEQDLHGFGFEGAVMATTIIDGMTGSKRTAELIEGVARPHYFLSYIGVGFAMARLPRRLWSRALPDLRLDGYHPTLSWLAVDGYGFDLAYFDRHRWISTGDRPQAWPFLDDPGYFLRAVDQGIGRALWFIEGGRPCYVAATIRGFAPNRRADLWSGVGLGAAFAGPLTTIDYGALIELAGEYVGYLQMGAALAARARTEAGLVPAHTAVAVSALTGGTVEEAADLVQGLAVLDPGRGLRGAPAYAQWRERIVEAIRGTESST